MPLYEYECRVCKKKTDSIEKMDTQTIVCVCGEVAVKIPSLSNFHLKGGGWAKDNYGLSKNSDKKNN